MRISRRISVSWKHCAGEGRSSQTDCAEKARVRRSKSWTSCAWKPRTSSLNFLICFCSQDETDDDSNILLSYIIDIVVSLTKDVKKMARLGLKIRTGYLMRCSRVIRCRGCSELAGKAGIDRSVKSSCTPVGERHVDPNVPEAGRRVRRRRISAAGQDALRDDRRVLDRCPRAHFWKLRARHAAAHSRGPALSALLTNANTPRTESIRIAST